MRGDAQPCDAAAVHLGDGNRVAGDLDRVACRRQLAKDGEHVPGRRLVGSLGQPDAGLLREVVQVEQSVGLDFAPREPGGRLLTGVVLVGDVPDQLLDQVLKGDDAGRAAVLIGHDCQVHPLAPHLRQRRQHRLADRQELDRPDRHVDERVTRRRGRAEQVPDVHEPDHVVVGVLVDRQPRVGNARRDPGRLADRGAGREELNLGAGPEHLADLPLPRVEDLADDTPLVRAQRLGAGDQLAHLLLGHCLAALPRVGAKQPHHHVDRHREQPHDRPGQPGDHVQGGCGEHCDRHRALQRQPLRGQLAEHQGQERDARGHHRERQRLGHVVAQSLLDHPGAQQPGQRVSAVGAGHQGGQGGADLHRGQEPVGVGGQLGRLRSPTAALGQRVNLALAQRDQGHLGRGEEPADSHDDEDDDDIQDDLAQAVTADFLRLPLALPLALLSAPRAMSGPGRLPSSV